ncbi:MAG: type II toxin-antitoxin system VapB family antitoxin [Dermatophilaceae bacterium]
MPINIKDEATDRLARALAHETGESITLATRVAIEERLARIRAGRRAASGRDEVTAIIERGRRRQTLEERSPEDVIGYDEHGLPR